MYIALQNLHAPQQVRVLAMGGWLCGNQLRNVWPLQALHHSRDSYAAPGPGALLEHVLVRGLHRRLAHRGRYACLLKWKQLHSFFSSYPSTRTLCECRPVTSHPLTPSLPTIGTSRQAWRRALTKSLATSRRRSRPRACGTTSFSSSPVTTAVSVCRGVQLGNATPWASGRRIRLSHFPSLSSSRSQAPPPKKSPALAPTTTRCAAASGVYHATHQRPPWKASARALVRIPHVRQCILLQHGLARRCTSECLCHRRHGP